jgi:hypothetical protein
VQGVTEVSGHVMRTVSCDYVFGLIFVLGYIISDSFDGLSHQSIL